MDRGLCVGRGSVGCERWEEGKEGNGGSCARGNKILSDDFDKVWYREQLMWNVFEAIC